LWQWDIIAFFLTVSVQGGMMGSKCKNRFFQHLTGGFVSDFNKLVHLFELARRVDDTAWTDDYVHVLVRIAIFLLLWQTG
jgi:hypothetical protein